MGNFSRLSIGLMGITLAFTASGCFFITKDIAPTRASQSSDTSCVNAKAQTYFGSVPAARTCDTPGTTCCSSGVACIGAKCDRRCSECDSCAGSYCCAPNGMGHPVTCSATPSCP